MRYCVCRSIFDAQLSSSAAVVALPTALGGAGAIIKSARMLTLRARNASASMASQSILANGARAFGRCRADPQWGEHRSRNWRLGTVNADQAVAREPCTGPAVVSVGECARCVEWRGPLTSAHPRRPIEASDACRRGEIAHTQAHRSDWNELSLGAREALGDRSKAGGHGDGPVGARGWSAFAGRSRRSSWQPQWPQTNVGALGSG